LNDQLNVFDSNSKFIQSGKVFKILRRFGMKHLEMLKAVAGDIVQIAGFSNATVTHSNLFH
jgi:GTP-binding protein